MPLYIPHHLCGIDVNFLSVSIFKKYKLKESIFGNPFNIQHYVSPSLGFKHFLHCIRKCKSLSEVLQAKICRSFFFSFFSIFIADIT